jgi:predicted glutamine amidotransferase
MCGLVALHTKSNLLRYHVDEFKQKMLINSLRGAHSTGIAGFKGGRYNFIKSNGSPYALYNHAESTQFFEGAIEYQTIIGHGRHATRGEINAYNQHPFREGNIVLAHNGGITNYNELRDEKKHSHITVDSHLVCALINEQGYTNVLPQLQGAYVLMWYDLDEETFHIVRNSQRPLWMAQNTADTMIYFASEKETLIWNSTRNNTPIHEPQCLPIHQVWTFERGSIEATTEDYVPKPISYNVVTTRKPKDKAESKNAPYNRDEVISFTPVDYKEFKNATHIIGETLDGDTVRCQLPSNMNINDVFAHDTLYCKVETCHWSYQDEVWSLWCLGMTIESDDAMVKLRHRRGYDITITKTRYDYLLSGGCEYCLKPLRYRDHKRLMFTDYKLNGSTYEGLVCHTCQLGGMC